MHLSEGVLNLPVLAAGAAATAAGIWQSLRKTSPENIPKLAMLTAVFFLASFIHFPIGVTSIHLILSGIIGILLGIEAFLAIFAGLALQAILFHFGGITTLGINTFAMAAPAVLCQFIFAPLLQKGPKYAFWGAFLIGSLTIGFAAIIIAMALFFSGKELLPAAKLLIISNMPLMLIEGLITGVIYNFILKVKPEILRKKSTI